MSRERRRFARIALVGSVAAVGLAACGSGSDAVAAPELVATGAWARPTPAGADEGVVYLTLTTDRTDALVGAAVDDTVAAEVQLHQTTGGGGGTAHDHGAAASGDELVSMGAVEELPIAVDAPLVFEPGASHVMLVGLVEPLVDGDRFDLELRMSSGRTVEVDVPVRVNPPER
jgi:copper(I)-binding protein